MTIATPIVVVDPGRGRRGMTLVELLVVVGLLSVFMGLMVTGLRGSRSQNRDAETLGSFLAAAQSRALGSPEGGAAILVPDAAAPDVCTSLFDGVMMPLIEATVTGIPPTPPSSVSASAGVTSTNGGDVQRAYKILLYGAQDSPGVAPPTAWLAFTPPGTVAFRTTLGQSQTNTVWPKPPAGGAFSALLAQYPVKGSTAGGLDGELAVDLRFSGIGDDTSTSYGSLAGKGAIAVVFDRTGRVAELIQNVPEPGASATAGAAQPAIPVGPIYFLVAPRDDIVKGLNTLASDGATWVALSPQTGRIFVADNVPQAATDAAALREARAKARQGIGVGR